MCVVIYEPHGNKKLIIDIPKKERKESKHNTKDDQQSQKLVL